MEEITYQNFFKENLSLEYTKTVAPLKEIFEHGESATEKNKAFTEKIQI